MNAELIRLPVKTAGVDPRRPLENAVVRLLKRRPFYGHLLLGLEKRLRPGSHAVGLTLANGTPTLCVDPEQLAVVPPAEQQALLEHVIKHLLHLHPVRGRGCPPRLWDTACDLAINPTIADLPPDALRPARFRLEEGLAAEEYAQLLKSAFDLGRLDGSGLGDAAPQEGETERPGAVDAEGATAQRTVDDHRVWSEADSTPERLAEQAVRDLVREAHRKAHGEVPEDIGELVCGWLAPPAIPWRQVLRQFVGTAGRIGRQGTWQRSHRRFDHDTPGVRKRQMLNLLVAIDVSESTDEAPLRESFARELLQIARGRDCRITVLYAHSRIRRIDRFRSSQAVAEVVHGGGFTDLRPVFDYARAMQPRPAAVIYLTDGEGPAPETMEVPTLWVLTPDGRRPAAWGVELRLGDER